MNFSVLHLPNPGVIIGKIPDELFSRINVCLETPEVKAQTVKHKLVSKAEAYFTPEIPGLQNHINDAFLFWTKTFNMSIPQRYHIGPIWTNFMKRGDFNPNHNHNGAYVSFVIWIRIPYDLKEESRIGGWNNVDQTSPFSCFEFTYNKLDGQINRLCMEIDKSYEGTMIMFPSSLQHCVYPFYTSEEERISIAGNIIPMRD